MKSTLVSKDFMLVVIGQIISLFGNAALRFALPLYLLNLTGSSAVYGVVTACAFIPAILLSPIGGIVADRVNKRNIMVLLDFATALLLVLFLGMVDLWNPVVLIALTLMILYGIAGAYQPSVQASIPALVHEDEVMIANAIINTISFFFIVSRTRDRRCFVQHLWIKTYFMDVHGMFCDICYHGSLYPNSI